MSLESEMATFNILYIGFIALRYSTMRGEFAIPVCKVCCESNSRNDSRVVILLAERRGSYDHFTHGKANVTPNHGPGLGRFRFRHGIC